MEKLFKDSIAYTPKMLAASHGLTVEYWDYIIRNHLRALGLPVICVSKSLGSQKQRVAAFGRDLNAWDEKMKSKAIADRLGREEKQQPQKQNRTQKKQNLTEAGFTPDGKIPTSRQLKEAGKWKGA